MKRLLYPFVLISFFLLVFLPPLFPENLTTRQALVQIMKGINEREIAIGLDPTVWTRYDDNEQAVFNPPDNDIPDNWLEGKNLYAQYLCDIKGALHKLIHHFYNYTDVPPEYFYNWEIEFPEVESYEEGVKKYWETLKKLNWMKLHLESPGYLKWENGSWSWVDDYWGGRDYYQWDWYGGKWDPDWWHSRKFFGAEVMSKEESHHRVYYIPNSPISLSKVNEIKIIFFWVYEDYYGRWRNTETEESEEWHYRDYSDFYGLSSFLRKGDTPPTAYPPVPSVTVHLSPSYTLPAQPPGNDFWSLSPFTNSYNWWYSWREHWEWRYSYNTEFWYEKGETSPEIYEEVKSDSGIHEEAEWEYYWEWTRKTYTTEATLRNFTIPMYITCHLTPTPDQIESFYSDASQDADADSYSWYIAPVYLWLRHIAAHIDFHYPQGSYTLPSEREHWLGRGCPDPAIVISSSVNLSSGNLFQDFPLFSTGGERPLSLTLYYNSLDDYSGEIGNKWIHNYNQFLQISQDTVVWKDEDGTYIIFEDEDEDGLYTPQKRFGEHSTLKETETGWLLENKEREKYYFDEEGRLTRIEDRNGNTLTLSYAEGKLREAKDSSGRKITFTYDEDGYLEEIKDPQGN
ncbi:RHS repeat protein, partial [Candidatus Calescamantes bacterium]|nr:RHS repeat protein [Candidatus Calescamantes bacterium]